MHKAVHWLEIFHGVFYIPVCHSITRQFQPGLGHASFLTVVWDAYKTFVEHDIRHNRRRRRAVRQEHGFFFYVRVCPFTVVCAGGFSVPSSSSLAGANFTRPLFVPNS